MPPCRPASLTHHVTHHAGPELRARPCVASGPAVAKKKNPRVFILSAFWHVEELPASARGLAGRGLFCPQSPAAAATTTAAQRRVHGGGMAVVRGREGGEKNRDSRVWR